MKYLKITAPLLLIAVLTIFISAPTKYMQSFFDGITVWAYNVLPAVFPFMVLTTLTLKLQPKRRLSFTKLLFGADCDNAFLVSLLCGYPAGARAVADSSADVETSTAMCSFCSTAGPVFMIATVGASLLKSVGATVILITAHIVSALINGVIFARKINKQNICRNEAFKAEDFGEAVTNSALSIISVGGIIALFYMLTDMIKSLLPRNIAGSLTTAFVIGLFEMTNGIFGVCNLTDVATATVLCSALLSFGGLCVFMQCYAFLGKKNIKPLAIFKMKITQSAIATILSFLLTQIFLR